jgi:predicted TIM-barrel fold metal-dependent hydrolase
VIVDSHAHAYPAFGGASGHRSVAAHMRFLQWMMAFHKQPTRRLDDSTEEARQTLFGGSSYDFGALTEVNFRSAGFGRLAWTADGTDYYKQYLPPTLVDLSGSPDLMVAQMDYAGVDRAVLQAGHLYGELNSFLARAVKQHPTRFWALAQVSEWRLRHRSQRKRLERAIDEEHLHGLYFETVMPVLHGHSEMFDDPACQPFWDDVRDRNLPVFWAVTSAEPAPDPYMVQLRSLARWLRRYPDVPCLLTHGITHTYFERGDKVTVPEEIWEILSAPNLRMEILFPIQDGGSLEYPYAERWPLIRQLYERLGPEKLIWGSDMPNVERHCTYRQSLDYLRNHCDFIPPRHMDLICGENVERLMGAAGSA